MSNDSPFQNILLAALGTTPQIITESLYHLMVRQQIPIREIHLITTTIGRERAENALFQNGAGPFYRFCRDYGFSSTTIACEYYVITAENGSELNDIRTPEDNRAAADFFLSVTRKLTAREDTRIFATIAGGRKTMSAYLYLTMQLLGRDQDTLYHVLVQPERIESHPEFFYPLPGAADMEFRDRDKNVFRVPVEEIHIDMAEIPFVRLRGYLTGNLKPQHMGFSELVYTTQERLDHATPPFEAIIDLPGKKLIIHTRKAPYLVPLSPTRITVYYYIYTRGELVLDPLSQEKLNRELLEIYERYFPRRENRENLFSKDNLVSIRARINESLRKAIDHPLLLHYLSIQTDRDKYTPRYTIHLPR